mmetsp:Transcript_88777/g.248443  ORF Transcript_88777/g.248443 Transcript_88777/m.248443 type:complete len:285 (-) Transcript_88777:429-1283(-)
MPGRRAAVAAHLHGLPSRRVGQDLSGGECAGRPVGRHREDVVQMGRQLGGPPLPEERRRRELVLEQLGLQEDAGARRRPLEGRLGGLGAPIGGRAEVHPDLHAGARAAGLRPHRDLRGLLHHVLGGQLDALRGAADGEHVHPPRGLARGELHELGRGQGGRGDAQGGGVDRRPGRQHGLLHQRVEPQCGLGEEERGGLGDHPGDPLLPHRRRRPDNKGWPAPDHRQEEGPLEGPQRRVRVSEQGRAGAAHVRVRRPADVLRQNRGRLSDRPDLPTEGKARGACG